MKMSRFFGAVLFGVLCISGISVYAQSVPAPTYIISQPFSRNLSMGMRGEDVQRLQQFLNTHGSPVALQGPGSSGKETQLYGSATRAAVAAFQKTYSITPAVGYFGPLTRAKVLQMLSTSGGASAVPSVVSKVDTSGSRAWVDISWKPSSGATSYTIERQTGGGDFVVVDSTQKTSYQDRAVENFVTYYYRIIATNASGSSSPSAAVLGKIGNNGGGDGVPVVQEGDTDAPSISDVTDEALVDTATIEWSTDEAADSQVEYGTTSSYGSTTTLDTDLVTSHSVSLTGLSVNTTYHYRVRSSDAAGNVAYSDDATFTTDSEMPSGTIGLWYIDQYNASSRQVIANSASATPVSTNLMGAPRRMFTNSDWWTYASSTVTDLAATAPDGSNDATTVNGTGNWYLRPISGATLPAGTYTLAVNAKRNTSSDQQFAFYRSNTAIRSSAKTATSTWQRFTYTFTLSTASQFSQIGLGSIDGSTAGNIQIADFELYAGSSDLGPETYAGHLYVGVNSGDTRPTYSTGELNMSSTGVGLIQYPTTQTLTTFTAQALVSHTAANNAYSSYLSKVQGYSSFSAMSESSGVPASIVGGSSAISPTQNSGLWATSTKGYHTFTLRYDGTAIDYWVDDILLFHKVGALSATTLSDIYVNVTNTFTLYGKLKYAGAIALWDRALSDSEVRQSVAYQQSRAASSSITSTSATRVLVAEGDSITGGFSYLYPYKLGTNASPELFGANYAISNSTIASMVSRAATVDAILPPNRTGRTFILSVLIGANDLQSGYSGPGGSGVSGWLADLAIYLDARRAAGWKVALGTVLPRSAAGFNTVRNTANTTLRTWVGTHADAIFDFAADSTMGTDAAASNTTYYADGTHPTNAGQTLLEPIYRATINSM